MITTLLGDCRETLKTLPSASVQMICTSPPYWNLRDYGTATWDGGDADCEHRAPRGDETAGDKQKSNTGSTGRYYKGTCGKCGATRIDQQIGLEPTLALYIAALMDVFKECWRVLRDDGVMFVNIGDSYATQSPIRVSNHIGHSSRKGLDIPLTPLPSAIGLKTKDLIGIPWRLAFALQDFGFYLRSDIIWEKPSCMPESVTDRPTRSHEYVFLLSKRPHYFYDALSIAEPAVKTDVRETTFKRSGTKRNGLTVPGHTEVPHREDRTDTYPNGTRNRRTIWRINTQPSTDAHYAMMPERLAELCILAGSSPQACEYCGSPWERIVEREAFDRTTDRLYGGTLGHNPSGKVPKSNTRGMPDRPVQASGWVATCRCTNNGTGKSIVLDPFFGSGTTGKVAEKHGRDCIGCELNSAYLPMIEKRTNNVQTMMEVA